MGIGDFLVKIYAICHLNLYIKNKYNSARCAFIIEEYFSNLLLSVLNINFFTNYFEEFCIQQYSDQYATGLGTNIVQYKNKKLKRVFSAINDFRNNNKGYWEVYSDTDVDIPFELFDYRDPSTRKSEPIPDYDLKIFQDRFQNFADIFVKEKLANSFDSIYYRSLNTLDYNHLNNFISKLKNYPFNSKNIFVTSNSEIAKSYICKALSKALTYRDIDISKADGYGTASSDAKKIEDLITEMIILSYSDIIHYGGNHQYISLFNYYAHLVKRVPLINY